VTWAIIVKAFFSVADLICHKGLFETKKRFGAFQGLTVSLLIFCNDLFTFDLAVPEGNARRNELIGCFLMV